MVFLLVWTVAFAAVLATVIMPSYAVDDFVQAVEPEFRKRFSQEFPSLAWTFVGRDLQQGISWELYQSRTRSIYKRIVLRLMAVVDSSKLIKDSPTTKKELHSRLDSISPFSTVCCYITMASYRNNTESAWLRAVVVEFNRVNERRIPFSLYSKNNLKISRFDERIQRFASDAPGRLLIKLFVDDCKSCNFHKTESALFWQCADIVGETGKDPSWQTFRTLPTRIDEVPLINERHNQMQRLDELLDGLEKWWDANRPADRQLTTIYGALGVGELTWESPSERSAMDDKRCVRYTQQLLYTDIDGERRYRFTCYSYEMCLVITDMKLSSNLKLIPDFITRRSGAQFTNDSFKSSFCRHKMHHYISDWEKCC